MQEATDYSPEEQAKIQEIRDIIFSSNIIFYPDKEYAQEQDNIDSNRFFECVQTIEDLYKKRKENVKKDTEVQADISELNLSNRALNCLRRAHINTIESLCSLTSKQLVQIKALGKGTLKEIRNQLEAHGLSLAETIPENSIKMEDSEGVTNNNFEVAQRQEELEVSEELGDEEEREEENTPKGNNASSELEEVRRKKTELEVYARELERQTGQAKELLESYKKIFGVVDRGTDEENLDFRDE